MNEIKKLSNIEFYRMRIKRGESIVDELKKFMLDKKPGSVTFIVEAGGGFTDVECAFSIGGYPSDEHPNAPYINYFLSGPHEISGTTGNIVWHPENPNEPMVHLHTTLGSNKSETWVAHLHKAKVMATAEILLITSDDKERITRKHDKELNLWLLDLSSQTTTGNPANSNKPGSSWQVILPVGLIVLGLMAIIALLSMREKKNKKK